MAGYIDMFSCTDVPFEYDMKEILNVLSVPEMKEILKELPKVSILSSTPFLLCKSMLFAFSYPIIFLLSFRITICSCCYLGKLYTTLGLVVAHLHLYL